MEFCRNSGTVIPSVPQMSLHCVYSIKLRAVTTPPRSWGISQKILSLRRLRAGLVQTGQLSRKSSIHQYPNWATPDPVTQKRLHHCFENYEVLSIRIRTGIICKKVQKQQIYNFVSFKIVLFRCKILPSAY